MSDAFDPYFKWLGIPKADQPPHAYRLLGIELFESDTDVISNAADGRMAQIKNYQSGKFGAVSQKLLNEIAAAKVCLLKPEKKVEYDQRLRTAVAKKDRRTRQGLAPGRSGPKAAHSPGGRRPDTERCRAIVPRRLCDSAARTTARTATKAKKSNWLVPTMVGAVAVALAAGAAGIYIYASGGWDKLDHPQASLQGDNHHAALPSGSGISPVKNSGAGSAAPKSSASPSAESSDSRHAPAANQSAASPATDPDTDPKPKTNVTAGPETPNPEETVPKTNSGKTDEKPDQDQAPPKEELPTKKGPMPDPAQFQAVKVKILKIFQKEFADAKTAQAKLALAARLDAQADSSKGEPAELACAVANSGRQGRGSRRRVGSGRYH